MFEHIKISIRITIALLVITCGLYPLAVWGIGQIAFRDKANGSLITRNGKVVGSELIGQNFAGERFFHARPSNAGSDGYDASASGGTNWGATSKKLLDAVTDRTTKYADTKPARRNPRGRRDRVVLGSRSAHLAGRTRRRRQRASRARTAFRQRRSTT